jgi:hypothetical protein
VSWQVVLAFFSDLLNVLQGVEETLGDIGDVESGDPIRLGVNVRMSVLSIDAQKSGSDLAPEDDCFAIVLRQLHERIFGEEMARPLENFFGEHLGHGYVPHGNRSYFVGMAAEVTAPPFAHVATNGPEIRLRSGVRQLWT